MTEDNKRILKKLLDEHKRLGISEQIDYDKFYLYSIITHSTAIEGSTVTEVEAQLLFDEGITSSKRSIVEMNMNLDLKDAYDYGRKWIKRHEDITIDILIMLASKVMARTGAEYNSMGGSFDASKGELRKLNVTAGAGGKSYLSYLKVPQRLEAFCKELNNRRKMIDVSDTIAIYELSFWAHFELVTIHPWADGNGRTSRLLMNLLQMEHNLLPTKVLKEDKAEYIQALVDTREAEDVEIFINCMASLHTKQIAKDIEYFRRSTEDDVQKNVQKELSDRQRVLIDMMIKYKSITLAEMSKRIGVSSKTVQRDIEKLRNDGLIERIGGRTYGEWRVMI